MIGFSAQLLCLSIISETNCENILLAKYLFSKENPLDDFTGLVNLTASPFPPSSECADGQCAHFSSNISQYYIGRGYNFGFLGEFSLCVWFRSIPCFIYRLELTYDTRKEITISF